jgi:hypothetical protein
VDEGLAAVTQIFLRQPGAVWAVWAVVTVVEFLALEIWALRGNHEAATLSATLRKYLGVYPTRRWARTAVAAFSSTLIMGVIVLTAHLVS